MEESSSNASTIRFGARIEFYEQVIGDEPPISYVGAAVLSTGQFAAISLPRVGEHVSVLSLVGGDQAQGTVSGELRPWAGGPFLRVAGIEHYPISVSRSGALPSWWARDWTTPGVHLVFHAVVPRDGTGPDSLREALSRQGWTVDPDLDLHATGAL